VGSRNASLGEEAVRRLIHLDGKTGHHHHINHPTVVSHQLDVTDSASIQKTVHYIQKHYGKFVRHFSFTNVHVEPNIDIHIIRIDGLINNAGVYIDGWDEKTWNETMKTNLEGAIKMTEAVLPLMKQQNEGRIVNVSSVLGLVENLSRRYQDVFIHHRQNWETLDQLHRGLCQPSCSILFSPNRR
jgi:NAD(P)-dependent dehydrogenase (short-subunit alcohol dehydrogenase family)